MLTSVTGNHQGYPKVFEEDRKPQKQLATAEPMDESNVVSSGDWSDRWHAAMGYRINSPLLHAQPVVKEIVENTLNLGGKGLAASWVAVASGSALNQTALKGAGITFSAANELNNGMDYLCLKLKERQLIQQREAIQKKLVSEPDNVNLAVLLEQLEKKIERQEQRVQTKGKAFLKAHVQSTISIISNVFRFSARSVDQIAAGSGALLLSLVGLATSITGIYTGVKAIQTRSEVLAKLDQLPEVAEDGSQVEKALCAVKHAALDKETNHQKIEIGLSIFQNAFSACTSTLGIAGGALAIASLAGVTLSASAVAFTGIGLPIVAGVGLLIAGGIAIYTHRHTIARGLKGLFGTREGHKHGRFSPKRNLWFRQWRVQEKLADARQKIDKLESKIQYLDPGSEKFAPIDQKIRENIKRQTKLIQENEEIKLKRAAQILRDQSSVSRVQGSEAEEQSTSVDVLNKAVDALPDDEIGTFAQSCKARFPGMKLDRFGDKFDKKSYLKIKIQKAISNQALF